MCFPQMNEAKVHTKLDLSKALTAVGHGEQCQASKTVLCQIPSVAKSALPQWGFSVIHTL